MGIDSAGLVALGYGPLAARSWRPWWGPRPTSSARCSTWPSTAAQHAVEALQSAGLSDAQISAVADQAAAVITSSDPDPALAQRHAVDPLMADLGSSVVIDLGTQFATAHPLSSSDLEIGTIDPAAARASSYTCLA